MYLWELEIDKIPCGWEETYKEALQECPNGKLIEIDYGDEFKEYFYNPVACHELIVTSFNKAKLQAYTILAEKNQFELGEFVDKIVKVDAKLFYIIYMWTLDNEDMDCSSYNPQKFLSSNELEFMEVYMSDDDDKFASLKLIKQGSNIKIRTRWKLVRKST